MPQSAPQPDPQQYLQSLMQAGQEVVQQFEHALSGGAVIAPSDLKWPAATPTSIADLFDLQRRYFEQMGQLWSSFLPGLSSEERKPVAAPAKGDNRFQDEAWQKEPYYDAVKQSYLIGAKFLHDFVEQANVDEKMKMQLRFYARQFTDAISPSNFPMTNPEVIRTAIDTRCESLTEGMKNLMEDIQKGRISMTDESAFEVGENIAITPGEVIYENELIQLIQYKPTVQADDRAGGEATAAARAPLHQQILRPRPRARELLRPLCARAAPSGVPDLLAQRRRVDRAPYLGRLHREGHRPGRRGRDRRRQGEGREHLRLLRRRDAAWLRGRRHGRARRRPARQRHAAHHHAGLRRHRRDRHHGRRELRADPRGDHRPGRDLARQGACLRVLDVAGERPDLVLRGQQLPEGRDPRRLRSPVLELGQRQPAGADVLLVHPPRLSGERHQGSRPDGPMRRSGRPLGRQG